VTTFKKYRKKTGLDIKFGHSRLLQREPIRCRTWRP